MKYPYSRPKLNQDDISEVVKILQGQYLTQGPAVDSLERALCKEFGVQYAVVCNSATAALHLSYISLGLKPNNGLITTPITFLSTANAALMCGAKVGFADVCGETGNINLESIKTAVERANFDVRVISIVHLAGLPCEDIAGIATYAQSIGAFLVEDACHAPLAEYSDGYGKKFTVGSCSHSEISTLSFHAIKHITAGEGGVLLTNDGELAERARLLRSHGITRDASKMDDFDNAGSPWYYEMHQLGYNYRLSDINCALCLNQVSKLAANIQRRQKIAELYNAFLGDLDIIRLPETTFANGATHAWHLFAPAFDFDRIGKPRKQVMAELAELGVGTQVHYIPLYRQPYYRQDFPVGMFDGSESYYKSTLSLPMYYGLNDKDVETISAFVRSVIDV